MYFLKNREYCVWYISPFRVKLRGARGVRLARLFLRQGGAFTDAAGERIVQAPKKVMRMSPISVAATRVRVPPKRSAMLLEPMFAVTPMV